MKKSILRLISVMLMLALLTAFHAFADTTVEQQVEVSTVTEQPVKPEGAEAPENPKSTEEPEVTEETESTEEPEVTEESEATGEPETTVEPEMTEEPEATGEPEMTEESEATGEPETTVEPEMTEEPEATGEPEMTEEPEATVEPETAEEPEDSEVYAVTLEEITDELTTSPVDNSTTLSDGEYAPTGCTGSSEKVTFTCPKVTVRDGKATATLVISSSKYDYVKASGGKYETAAYSGGGVYVEIPVDLNADNHIVGHTTAMGGKEIEYTIHIALDETVAEDQLTTSPVDNSTVLPDGEYVPTGCTGSSEKVTFTCPKVTVKDGEATAILVISSSKYDYVKASGGKYETAVYSAGGVYVEIPVDLNADNRIVGHTTAMGGKEIEYTIHITLDETAPQPTPDSGEDTEHTVETDNKMFKIIRSVLMQKDGQYSAQITLSGTGYDKLYIGTAEQAMSDSGNWIGYSDTYDYTNDDGEAKTGYVFNIPVSAVNTPIPVAAYSVSKDVWYDRNITFTVAVAEPTPAPDAGEDTEHTVETDNKMFKIIRSVLTQKDGQYRAQITLSGTGYDKLYMGTAEQAVSDSANWIAYSDTYDYTSDDSEAKTGYVFNIPVSAVNTPIPVAAYSVSKDVWYDRNITFTVVAVEPAPNPGEECEHTVETTGTMFNIIRSVLTQKDGQYSAQITLSGTGYDMVYMGIAADAANDSANWIAYSDIYDYTNDAGEAKTGYVFNIPVSAVNTALPIAAHAVKSGEWKDRTVTFIVATAEPTPEPTPIPSPTPTPTPVTVPMPGKVNSSTSLADGTYTPDKFSWSGGSGRTSISCSKVTVKNGKAYATISFSSDSYAYVKANGSKYYGGVVGGRSTFEIPVNLNVNNNIVGMTTAMSADHEIAYTIYVYIEGAKDSSGTAAANPEAQEAEIIGLNYVSTDVVENSKLYRVHRYEGGYVMIDVVNAGKYLVVPEGAELPVGIDEEATVIQQPVMSVHVGSEYALAMIDGMAMENTVVKTMGFADYPFANIDPESVVFAGSYDAPDYAALLKAACDLAIMPEVFAEPDVDEEPLPEELASALADVQERFDLLGIPMFVDRSADEETEKAKLEWIKVYGILLGCEEEANVCYETAMAELEVQA